jgi:hypothetical protein
MPTPHEKLRIAKARQVDMVWVKKLLKWIDSTENVNEVLIKNELKLWVEEYSPQLQVATETHFIMGIEQATLH